MKPDAQVPPAGGPSRSPLRAALSFPPFATVFVGSTISALGDGMAFVAIPWLAISLAHGHHAGLLVGAAVAAYTLPGVVFALGLGRIFSRWDGRLLILADAVLRSAVLGTVAAMALGSYLDPYVYVALLGVSSLLGLAATTGELTSVTELLPADQHVAGNSLLTVTSFATTMIGPALAGALIVALGAAAVVGVDAVSYLALIAAAAVSRRLQPPAAASGPPQSMLSSLRGLVRQPSVLGISVLCVAFFLLYGPVEVALPLYVSETLHSTATVLGGYWAAFAVGATLGALGASAVERFGLWKVAISSMVGWGMCLVPFGVVDSTVMGFGALALGGLVYGPFLPLKRAVIQRASPPGQLAVLAAASAMLTVPAAPLGTALGGPLVAALGPAATLLTSGVATVGAAILAGLVVLRLGRREPRASLST